MTIPRGVVDHDTITSYPYPQYDEVFVIIRVEAAPDRPRTPESSVGLVKALWSAAAAEAEVVRLNQSQRAPDTRYVWKAARLARRPVAVGLA
jgi:hypothetical protein